MLEALRRLNFIFFDDSSLFDASADKLVDAFQTDIGWVRKHTEYGERAREWMENASAAALLLRSPLLDQAETWLALRPTGAPAPTAETDVILPKAAEPILTFDLPKQRPKDGGGLPRRQFSYCWWELFWASSVGSIRLHRGSMALLDPYVAVCAGAGSALCTT